MTTHEEVMQAFKDGFDPREPEGTPIYRRLLDLDASVWGKPARKLADVPLRDVIADLELYVRGNAPGAAARLAEMVLARGGWISVGYHDEDFPRPAGAGGGPFRRYLVADYFEIGEWTPATASLATDALVAAEGAAEPANAAVTAVLRLVQQHAGPPPDEDFDHNGAYVAFYADARLSVPRAVSHHRTAAGAARAAQRRNEADPGTAYASMQRAELLRRREASLWAMGL